MAMLTQHNSFHLAKTVSCAVLDKTLPSNINLRKNDIIIIISKIYMINMKHRKNCECCPRHSLFKGHNVIVNIVVLNCQKCNQCLKCQLTSLLDCSLMVMKI